MPHSEQHTLDITNVTWRQTKWPWNNTPCNTHIISLAAYQTSNNE